MSKQFFFLRIRYIPNYQEDFSVRNGFIKQSSLVFLKDGYLGLYFVRLLDITSPVLLNYSLFWDNILLGFILLKSI
jgi:hypothetical protein